MQGLKERLGPLEEDLECFWTTHKCYGYRQKRSQTHTSKGTGKTSVCGSGQEMAGLSGAKESSQGRKKALKGRLAHGRGFLGCGSLNTQWEIAQVSPNGCL